MTFTPKFICPYCKKATEAEITGPETGMLSPCTCKESQQAWEAAHRAAIERRHKATRRGNKR